MKNNNEESVKKGENFVYLQIYSLKAFLEGVTRREGVVCASFSFRCLPSHREKGCSHIIDPFKHTGKSKKKHEVHIEQHRQAHHLILLLESLKKKKSI